MSHLRSAPRFLTILLASTLPTACGGGSSSEGPTDPETPVPANITITPPSATLNTVGGTVQFTATVRDQRGRAMTGQTVTWSSTETGVATISASGRAIAVAEGTSTIVATAAPGVTGWAGLTVDLLELEITTSGLASAVVGQAYEETLEATVALGQSWTVSDGSLPPGLSLDGSTGGITGTPTAAGVFTFSVFVSVAGGQTATRQLSITVVPGNLGIGFEDDQFVLVSSGSFQMGSATGQADEQPVHEVSITQPFYIQKTEVTQAQWRAIMGTNPSSFANCGDTCPVERVSWEMIQSFLQALNAAHPDKDFRLPTEAEWEYAARAGATGDYGGTGNLDEMGWYSANSGSKTKFVGLKEPNAWGLYDMHGNVYEWVADWYQADYYDGSPADDPAGPPGGTQKVLRGGSVDQGAAHARSANRFAAGPSSQGFTIYYGFRLARTGN